MSPLRFLFALGGLLLTVGCGDAVERGKDSFATGLPKTWGSAGHASVSSLLVVDGDVYFADERGGSIFRLSKEGGLPRLVALAQKDVHWLATDGAEIFWIPPRSKQLRAAPRGGGLPARVVHADDQGLFSELAVDDTHVYYQRGNHELVRVPKEGGDHARLTEDGGPIVGQDDAFLYFARDGALSRVPLEGGAVEELAEKQHATEVVVDGDHVYWIDEDRDRGGPHDSEIRRVSKSGTAVEVLVRGETNPRGLAVHGKRVWFANGRFSTDATRSGSDQEREPAIASVPTSGGSVTRITQSNQVHGLAVDESWVYVVESDVEMMLRRVAR